MRRRVVTGTIPSGSSSEGKPSESKSGTAASSGSRNSPSTSTPFCCTGPPRQTCSTSATSGSSCGTTSATAAGEGRFRTSPAAPSSVCSVTRTTVRRKFGSMSDGEASSSWPRSESMAPFSLAVRLLRSARRQGDEQAAVIVVGGKEVRAHRFRLPTPRPELDLLPETADAPFERQLRRVSLLLEAREPERLDDVAAEQVDLRPPRQLEHTPARGEDPPLLIAHHEARARRRVVIVQQLEQEAEAAVVAGDGLVVQPLLAVDVDRPLFAVRADEVRHGLRLATHRLRTSRCAGTTRAGRPSWRRSRPTRSRSPSASAARGCRRSSDRRGRR